MTKAYPTSPGSLLTPYIGITGVQTPEHVADIARAAAARGIQHDKPHNLMIGALVSLGLVQGTAPTNTNKPCRHVSSVPLLRDILLAARDKRAIGMLHFELHKPWPGTHGDSEPVIALLKALSRESLSPPVQLNGVLFAEEIERIKKETGVPLVLQLRQEIAEREPSEMLSYIESVAPYIDLILIDPSAGGGHAIDLAPAISLRNQIDNRLPNRFIFGFAGGLGGKTESQSALTTTTVRQLTHTLGTPHFSVDTESGVRVPGPTPDTDVLSLELCERYFAAVVAGCGVHATR